MKIGLDVMGGDFAPNPMIEGAVDALSMLSEDDIIYLIGDKDIIANKLNDMCVDSSHFVIVPSSQTITMEESPARGFMQKPDSSIAVGYRLLVKKEIDGFCSAGNTGAMLVGASYTINVIPGVLRPALITVIPSVTGNHSVILDVGLNPDCKADVLVQYGMLGSVFAKSVLHKENPTVKLLNIGAEPSKGTATVKAAYEALKEHPSLNFCGNIEGNELFLESMPDVIVCDGFVGNIVLKQTEAMYRVIRHRFKGVRDEFVDAIDCEFVGGTPVVGVNGNIVIGHGASRRNAIMNMIRQTLDVVRVDLARQIRESI